MEFILSAEDEERMRELAEHERDMRDRAKAARKARRTRGFHSALRTRRGAL